MIVLAVIVRPQDTAAAGTFDLGVRRFQRKYGAGTHYLRTAFRADIDSGGFDVMALAAFFRELFWFVSFNDTLWGFFHAV